MANKKAKKALKATASTHERVDQVDTEEELLFNWTNYKFILIGIAFMVLGFILMAGGHMPSKDVWDDSLIYSFRRTVLAPILILIGLGIEAYAIFKK